MRAALFLVALLVVLTIGCSAISDNITTVNKPIVVLDQMYPEGHSVYSEYSNVVYPIHINSPNYTGWLFFDSYSTKESGDNFREVTVRGYWYGKNGLWEKCDGELVFRTSKLFVPVEYRPTQFEIISKDCGMSDNQTERK